VLLLWVPLRFFEVFHVLLFYAIGCAGTAAFKARYRLSWPVYLVFFLLFNFNGYLTSHLCVGHMVWWAGYYLLPWFFLLMLDWVEKGPSVRTSLLISLVLFVMSLAGSFHFCSWCMIFICLLGLRKSGWLKYAGLTALASGLLIAYRLAPGSAEFGRLVCGWSAVGYQSLRDMAAALVALRPPVFPGINAQAWWEYDMYVGFAGALILLAFGVGPLLPRVGRSGAWADYSRLDLPLAGMALLSYGDVYWWVLYGVPVLSVERVVSRLLIVPLVLTAMLASIRLEELRKRVILPVRILPWARIACGAVLLLLAADLLRHSWVWRISALAALFPGAYTPPVPPAIVEGVKDAYSTNVRVGWSVSLISLAMIGWVFLMRLLRGERRPRT
jgi:hypothetical protein